MLSLKLIISSCTLVISLVNTLMLKILIDIEIAKSKLKFEESRKNIK